MNICLSLSIMLKITNICFLYDEIYHFFKYICYTTLYMNSLLQVTEGFIPYKYDFTCFYDRITSARKSKIYFS